MVLFEAALSKLGSRFTLNLQPQQHRICVSALGKFLDAPADLALGVRLDDGQVACLPLTRRYPEFSRVEQEFTLTSITYRAHCAEMGLRFEVTFTSPFYPRDEKLSTAPFFYVDVKVIPISTRVFWNGVRRDVTRTGEVFLELQRPACEVNAERGGVRYAYKLTRNVIRGQGDRTFTGDQRDAGAGTVPCDELLALDGASEGEVSGSRIHWRFDISDGPCERHLVWAAHTPAAVMNTNFAERRFKYTTHFASAKDVVAYARSERETIVRRSRLFDSLCIGSSLSKSYQDFMAFSFQSYLLNTWWTVDEAGEDWFSVWEGICIYNSTVDVEYNLGLVYFALWPELLELTFREWARHVQPCNVPGCEDCGAGYLSHDMGAGLVANGQSYPHQMEVEENTNFVLMLFAHWRFTGSDAAIREHLGMAKRLVEYLFCADTTGNGFPNEGIANTIDDASPAVQWSREQTYLAVKALAACECAADIAEALGEGGFAGRCRQMAARTRATLDSQAWLGDHYAVCIDRIARGLKDPWTGEIMPEHELEGWDAYTLYTSNGLLYPLLVGKRCGVDWARMAEDMETATRESLIEYGCTHSSADRSNIWVSQNLWRDFTGAYMGLDYLDMMDRYWAFQVFVNDHAEGKCFIDTYLANNLCYYPRGITAMGVFFAAAGLEVDRVAGRVALRPVRVPLRVPLPALADWDAERIPWAQWRLENGEVTREVEGDDLVGPVE
jgi:hypothetical protein